jgi:hypothetical protein
LLGKDQAPFLPYFTLKNGKNKPFWAKGKPKEEGAFAPLRIAGVDRSCIRAEAVYHRFSKKTSLKGLLLRLAANFCAETPPRGLRAMARVRERPEGPIAP